MTKAPPTDALDRVRRLVALLDAGKPLPADIRRWLLEGWRGVLEGSDPAEAFGLTTAPATPLLRRAVRMHQRDAAIRALYALASGSALDRGEAVIGWHECHRDGAEVPAAAADHLAQVESAGVPFPQSWRQIVRIAAGR